ncbi:MAG TPA: hypothetical protein VFU03_11425 [Gemmatimonadales bacterium]|nr:hypothetical protein [Gemmatimonadales bacterium]
MLVSKLTLCAGAGVLWALATPFNTTWTATLSSVGGSNVTGTATVDVSDAAPGMNKPTKAKPDTTKVPGEIPGDTGKAAGGSWAAISINGATPGEYPWKIGEGRCGTQAMSVEKEGTYPPIKVDAEGRGTARANVPLQIKVGGEYSVSVLKSKSDRSVIACGKLEPAGGPAPAQRDTTAPKP